MVAERVELGSNLLPVRQLAESNPASATGRVSDLEAASKITKVVSLLGGKQQCFCMTLQNELELKKLLLQLSQALLSL